MSIIKKMQKEGKNEWKDEKFKPLGGGVYIFEIDFSKSQSKTKSKTKSDFKNMWDERASETYEKINKKGKKK